LLVSCYSWVSCTSCPFGLWYKQWALLVWASGVHLFLPSSHFAISGIFQFIFFSCVPSFILSLSCHFQVSTDLFCLPFLIPASFFFIFWYIASITAPFILPSNRNVPFCFCLYNHISFLILASIHETFSLHFLSVSSFDQMFCSVSAFSPFRPLFHFLIHYFLLSLHPFFNPAFKLDCLFATIFPLLILPSVP
jgi:hypothetical protein